MKGNSIFKSDGIVLLNKSRGISSFKAINKLIRFQYGSPLVNTTKPYVPVAQLDRATAF